MVHYNNPFVSVEQLQWEQTHMHEEVRKLQVDLVKFTPFFASKQNSHMTYTETLTRETLGRLIKKWVHSGYCMQHNSTTRSASL